MNRPLACFFAALLLLPGLAQASGAAATDKPVATTLKLQPVAIPIIVRGQLVNYIFVNAQLTLDPRADAEMAKKKEPFIRDALVRAVHRAPVTMAADYTVVDEAKLKSTLLTAANGVLGSKQATEAALLSQTTRQRGGFRVIP